MNKYKRSKNIRNKKNYLYYSCGLITRHGTPIESKHCLCSTILTVADWLSIKSSNYNKNTILTTTPGIIAEGCSQINRP